MTDTTTDRSVLDITLDAIPRYRDTEAALNRLNAHRLNPPPGESVDALMTEVMEAAMSGEPFPENIGQRTVEAARVEPVIFDRARLHLRGRMDEARRVGAHDAIAKLRELFDDLITEARELVPALAGARSAEEAEAKGPQAEAAWAHLAELARRHGEIRMVQWAMVREVHSSEIELQRYVAGAPGRVPQKMVMDVGGWLSNYAELWPDWRERIRYGAISGRVGGIASPPWPHTVQSPECPDFASPAALLWMITGPGKPWLPTIREAATVYVAAADAEGLRRLEADERRAYGRVLNNEDRRKARDAADARQREAEQQIDLHRRRALHSPPTYTD